MAWSPYGGQQPRTTNPVSARRLPRRRQDPQVAAPTAPTSSPSRQSVAWRVPARGNTPLQNRRRGRTGPMGVADPLPNNQSDRRTASGNLLDVTGRPKRQRTRTTTTTAATTRSGNTRSSGGGGTSTSSTSSRPARSGARRSTSSGSGRQGRGNTNSSQSLATRAAASVYGQQAGVPQYAEPDWNSLYGPARAEIERQRTENTARLDASNRDWNAFNDWAEARRQEANASLVSTQQAVGQDATAARQSAQQTYDNLIGGARGLLEGDRAAASGWNAMATGGAAQASANAADAALNANQAALDQKRMADMQQSNRALAAQMYSQNQLDYRNRDQEIASSANDLATQQAQAKAQWQKDKAEFDQGNFWKGVEQSNVNRQAALDRRSLDWAMALQGRQQGLAEQQFTESVRQFNSQQEFRKYSAQLEAQVAQGNLNAKQAQMQLQAAIAANKNQQWAAQFNLSKWYKQQQVRLRAAQQRTTATTTATNNANQARTQATAAATKFRQQRQQAGWKPGKDTRVDGQIIKATAIQIHTQFPNLTAEDAMRILINTYGDRAKEPTVRRDLVSVYGA